MIDSLISSDLAALGRHAHARVPNLDDAMGGLPGERASLSVEDQLRLVPLAAAYVRQMARAAWGATALVCVAVLLVSLNVPPERWYYAIPSQALSDELASWLYDLRGYIAPTCVFVIACAAAQIVRRRTNARLAADGDVRRRLSRIPTWTFVLEVAGVASFVTLFTVMLALSGDHSYAAPWEGDGGNTPLKVVSAMLDAGHWPCWPFDDGDWFLYRRIHDVTVLVPVVIACAACIGWSYRHRPHLFGMLRHRFMCWGAVALIVGGIFARSLFDETWYGSVSSFRSGLAILFAVAALVAATSRALRARTVSQ